MGVKFLCCVATKYHATSRTNSTFLTAHAVAKGTQKAQSYAFSDRVYRSVGPTRSVFVIHLSVRVNAITRGFSGRPQYAPCAPDFPVHTK
jgi:hypothetical protein